MSRQKAEVKLAGLAMSVSSGPWVQTPSVAAKREPPVGVPVPSPDPSSWLSSARFKKLK